MSERTIELSARTARLKTPVDLRLRGVLMLSACLGVGIALTGCASAPKEPRLTQEQRALNVESFDQVWTTVKEKHWDPQLGGLDWGAVREELRPAVESAPVMSEARAVMREMVSRLGKSHFGIIPGEVYDDVAAEEGKGNRDGDTGVEVRVDDGHALVTSVAQGSWADESGLRPGWEVVSVGDYRIPAALSKAAKELEETPGKRYRLWRMVSSRLSGQVGDTIIVTFLDTDEREVELELTVAQKRGRKAQFGNFPDMYVWAEAKTLDESVGYIAFNAWFDPVTVMATFNDAMLSFMNADGIVIDIRGNTGGIPGMAMGMAGWMIADKSHYLGTMYLPGNELKLVVTPRAVNYDGPVAVLIDELSGSTSEFFAGGLKSLGRARIFGARSAGAALISTVVRLPNGDGFQYAFANYISQGGEELEGVGVIPDVEVIPSREALLRGEDPALLAALAWIHSQR